MGEIDRRTARTKRALKRAMLELLDKQDISKITVSELTKLADVGRGTFYLHYLDAYDLLDKLEDEQLAQITGSTSSAIKHHEHDNLLAHLEYTWQYIYDNMDVFRVLMNRNNVTRFMDKMKSYFIKNFFIMSGDNSSNAIEAYRITYYISGSLGIFQKWIEDGAPIPPNQLAQIARELIAGTPRSEETV